MLKSLLSVIVISFLTGCTNHSAINQEAVSSSTTPIAHSFEQAIQLASATPLPVDRGLFPERWEIGATDPRLEVGQAPGNYRVFDFKLRKGQTYVINVISMCNNMCFGFSKTILKPRVTLVDAQGNLVADHLEGQNPLAIEWSGVAPADGRYFLIIAADNDKPGATVLTVNAPVPGYTGMTVPVGMASAPFGKVIAYLEIPGD
ncbi:MULTISPECIES: hypothetical protein [unclassified Pseudomonas]|uniref:hypothetical protein n=1 Tax=Pseudomonas TaxID=286 RepID=UPI002006D56F|nr:hypothetical protein [Pseudomonas sp. EYE_354]MCK6188169.1 hypothetical protein [Pseudomonas sp. EYE_354]